MAIAGRVVAVGVETFEHVGRGTIPYVLNERLEGGKPAPVVVPYLDNI